MGVETINQKPNVFSSFTTGRTVQNLAAQNISSQPQKEDAFIKGKETTNKTKKQKIRNILIASLGVGIAIAGGFAVHRIKNPIYLLDLSKNLDDRIDTAVAVLEIAHKKALRLTKKASKEMEPFLERPHITSTSLTVAPKALQRVPVSKLLEAEENQFVEITGQFSRMMDEFPAQMQIYVDKCAERREKLIPEISAIIDSAKKQIQELTQDLPESAKEEKSQKVVSRFHSSMQHLYEKVDTIMLEKCYDFDIRVAGHYGFVTELGDFISDKNQRLSAIIEDTGKAIQNRINRNAPEVLAEGADDSFLDVIPASLPQSILQSHFLRFSRNVNTENPRDFITAIHAYTEEMNNRFSIKDIDIMIERLKLRENVNPNEKEWYNMTIKKMQMVRAAIDEVLFNNLKNAGKNIDPDNLSEDDMQTIIEILQKHSEKMGYKGLRQVMASPRFFENDAKSAEFMKSPIFKIYQKIIPHIKDGGLYFTSVLR